jgi:hypothetical protein
LEELCGASGSAVETAIALHRVDKQLVAAQEDDPWRTGPAMLDLACMKRKQAGGRLPAPAALQLGTEKFSAGTTNSL